MTLLLVGEEASSLYGATIMTIVLPKPSVPTGVTFTIGIISHQLKSMMLIHTSSSARFRAVLGNNDRGMILPGRLVVELDGCEVAAVHDSGPASGRTARLRRWFPPILAPERQTYCSALMSRS